jgi:hypothetical protein
VAIAYHHNAIVDVRGVSREAHALYFHALDQCVVFQGYFEVRDSSLEVGGKESMGVSEVFLPLSGHVHKPQSIVFDFDGKETCACLANRE